MSEATKPPFPNYMQTRKYLPLWVWHSLRALSVALCIGFVYLLHLQPELALLLFWGLFVPALPLILFIAPGFWRNVCPLVAVNQLPRLFGFSRAATLPRWLGGYAGVIAMALFFGLVSARKVGLNSDAMLLASLLAGMLVLALAGGILFKGKSGWCTSFCPMLPLERAYGQTPFLTVSNSHCRPCVACTRNCYDFNPKVAYLADLYDSDRRLGNDRKFFAGVLPGFIFAFFTLPSYPEISIARLYLLFGIYGLTSLGTYYLAETLIRVSPHKLAALYAALSLLLFYGFAAPMIAAALQQLGAPPLPERAVLALPAGLLLLGLIWLARGYWKEARFVALGLSSRLIPAGSNQPLFERRDPTSRKPQVTVMPTQRTVMVQPGATLLEVLEANQLPIESGCLMGTCGADPVAVLEGMENLAPATAEERATLERLGYGKDTRLACCARVGGDVRVSLHPEHTRRRVDAAAPAFPADRRVDSVVIVGNGVAGVTAADYVRRHHDGCEVHLVGREPHPFYNRMTIPRLIYGRSAMQGMYLLPEPWYDEHRITVWLNTQVVDVDFAAGKVRLGTGKSLLYDRLILAMGSRSFVPPIEGFGLDGSFVLREADDAMAIRRYAQTRSCRRAAVVGGGLLGLEAAYALHKLGLAVTILEIAGRLLPLQLDERGSTRLQAYLKTLGMETLLNARTRTIEGDRGVRQLVLEDGRRLDCELVLVAAGIAPDVDLIRGKGLRIDRGAVVDAHMRTSLQGVYAAGDVAQPAGAGGVIHGLWPVAVHQGRTAGINAAGGSAAFEEPVIATTLKIVGIDLSSIGRFQPLGAGDDVIALEDPDRHRYRKLVISGGRIAGAILLGYRQYTHGVTEAIRRRQDITPHLKALREGRWEALTGPAP